MPEAVLALPVCTSYVVTNDDDNDDDDDNDGQDEITVLGRDSAVFRRTSIGVNEVVVDDSSGDAAVNVGVTTTRTAIDSGEMGVDEPERSPLHFWRKRCNWQARLTAKYRRR
jgi:hypothetical protein